MPSSVPVALCDTFHFAAGLQAGPAVGDELAARQRNWDLVSADFVDGYRNTGFVDSPVERFDNGLAVRMHSAVNGNTGYTLGLGVTSTTVGCRWSDGWPTRTLRGAAGGMRFWRVSR